MKILIVDDNIAIQEILAEILTVDGYDIDKAGTVTEAIEKLDSARPDAILLDTQVGGRSGLEVLDALPEDTDVRAILLTKNKEQVPKDNNIVSGYIQKPFKSSDVMNSIRKLAVEMDIKQPKEKKFKFRLFGKHNSEDILADDDLIGVRFGKSYVIFEKEPDSVYKVASIFMRKDCDILLITASKVKSVTERFRDVEGKEVKILGLTSKVRIGYIEISRLGTIMDQIKKFMVEKERPAIIFDDLQTVIDANGLNNVMTMLYQIINSDVKKTSSLVVSTDDSDLTDKDKDLFLHNMEQYITEQE